MNTLRKSLQSRAVGVVLLFLSGAVLPPPCLGAGKGSVTLTGAVAANDSVAVRRLLDQGADVEAAQDGSTALILAASAPTDQPQLVALLLEHHAAVDARDKVGNTALMLAASHGAPAVVKLLIEAGADVNAKTDDGETALDGALDAAFLDPVSSVLLLQAGAK